MPRSTRATCWSRSSQASRTSRALSVCNYPYLHRWQRPELLRWPRQGRLHRLRRLFLRRQRRSVRQGSCRGRPHSEQRWPRRCRFAARSASVATPAAATVSQQGVGDDGRDGGAPEYRAVHRGRSYARLDRIGFPRMPERGAQEPVLQVGRGLSGAHGLRQSANLNGYGR